MQENSSTPNHEPIKPKFRFKALPFLEIGLFELGFVAIVLLLLFGTLNYFNILPISKVFPQLSWLPRQEKSNVSNTQQDLAPTPTISSEKSAQEILLNLLPQILNKELIPSESNTTIKQDNFAKENFTISWTTKEETANVNLQLSNNYKEISSIDISFLTEKISSPSVQLAQTAISAFFSVTSRGVWKCAPTHGLTYCENFWEEQSGTRRGLSILGPISSKNNTLTSTVSFCEHGKSDPILYPWKSCTNEFAENGIK